MKRQTSQKVVAIVEARMTSSRLPGKHLLEAIGKPMLGHLVCRLKAVASIDEIVIATTTNTNDDILETFTQKEKVSVFRGSEDDVMGRVLDAAQFYDADVICEVTGDCPIIDPMLIEQVIQTYKRNTAMYVNNGKGGLPAGMGAQVFTVAALKKSEQMTDEPLDREHVTLHIRNNPDLFPPLYLAALSCHHWPDLGVTLDEQLDYELLKRIIEHFGVENELFGCREVIELLREKSDWVAINESVRRKGDS